MRGIWFVAGTAAGVYATTRARRAAEALSVDGIHDRLTGWFAGARVLREELRTGSTERESELRARLSLVPDGGTPRRLTAGRHLRLAGRGGDTGHGDGTDDLDDTDDTRATGKGDD